MPYAPDTFPYELRPHYPHMKPADIAIWERFIRTRPKAFEFVQYSVPCGSSAPFDTLVNDETGGHDEYLYKRKIDVVGFKGSDIYIIELKPNAGPNAVGQVKMYRELYLKDYSPKSYPLAAIITDRADADVELFANKESVIMWYA